MAISLKDFRLMMLRPAKYSGSEIELDIVLLESELMRSDIHDVTTLGLIPGDTAETFLTACFDGNGSDCKKHIRTYISGDVLTKFIDKYGIEGISATTKAKFRLEYRADPYIDCDELYELVALVMTDIY